MQKCKKCEQVRKLLEKALKVLNPSYKGWLALWDDEELGWRIVSKEYYKKHKCVQDYHLEMEIPGFYETGESFYECEDEDKLYDGQVELLEKMGFEIGE